MTGPVNSGLQRGGAAIVGAAESDLGQVADGLNPIDLMAQGIARAAEDAGLNPFETPYRPFLPSTAYALAASRHMHEFGTKREQLTEVAVAARQWALLNPAAWEKKPLTVDEVLSARMVSYPFTVRDICLVTDGGGAIILTTRSEEH